LTADCRSALGRVNSMGKGKDEEENIIRDAEPKRKHQFHFATPHHFVPLLNSRFG
jgi:hypothetical protein